MQVRRSMIVTMSIQEISDSSTGTITVDGFKQPISVDPFAVHNVIIIIVKIIIEKQLLLNSLKRSEYYF